MLTEQEILERADAYLSSLEIGTDLGLIIGHDHTIKKSYGQVFFYNSKKFIETNNFEYALAGNAPFLVENKTGRVVIFGTLKEIGSYIEEYESGTWIPGENGIWEPEE